MSDEINLTIDGIAVTVPKGTTVYTAAKQIGIDIPIFCYQDRMPPFGACRMCLVEVEKMPKPQASCTLEATEGMVVKTQSQIAVDARKSIIEFLLINHPLDCPICDRGGECPLQENALQNGPGESRFFEDKRHFVKPIPLGPVLMLDRERCIVCARCTRFGDIVAGDHALEFIERGYKTEVGTPDGGPAESKFIGNTIMICPVGALTSKVYRFRARPWDNDPTDSTCTLCPVGCSLILDSRDGEIMRTRSRENPDINDIWLCDKGWFGYEFTYHPDRLQKPLIRRNGQLETAEWDEALDLIASKMEESKASGKLAGFGGDPLTVEENYLFQKLFRAGVGVNNIDHRIGTPIQTLEEEAIPPGMVMSIGETEKLSFAILCGLDLTEEFPVIWLRLKQAINKGAKVYFIGNYAPEISPHLAQTVLHPPGQELAKIQEHIPKWVMEGKKGAIFVGRQYLLNDQRRTILAELMKYRSSDLVLNIMEGRDNSMGARFAGMRPDLNPFGERAQNPGLNAQQVLEKASTDGWQFLYVAGADPAAQMHQWKKARPKIDFLVVQDLFLTVTARQADVVLPVLSYVEKGGNFVNIEGRVQKLRPGKMVPEGLFSDGEIFTKVAERIGLELTLDKRFTELLKLHLLPISHPHKLEAQQSNSAPAPALSASFAPALFDRGVRMKHDSHVIQLAKEPRARMHPQEALKWQLQDGDKIRINATITVKVKVDDGVALSTVVLPLGFEQIPVHDLAENLLNGLPLTVEKV